MSQTGCVAPASGESRAGQESSWAWLGSLASIVLGLIAVLEILWHSDHPSPGRGLGHVMLAAGSGCAIVAAYRSSLPRLDWAHPCTWLALALLWQTVITVFRSDYWEPPTVILAERVGALGCALGSYWLGRRFGIRRVAALAGGTAASLLVIAAVGLPLAGEPPRPIGWILGLGVEPPFGNPNFAVTGLVPLLPLLLLGEARSRLARLLVLGAGLLAAGALGSGLTHPTGDPVTGVWPIFAAAVIGWAILGRRHRLALGMLGTLAAAVLLAQLALVAGWIELPGALAGPSWYNRLGIWHGAWQAWLEAPAVGHGAGSASTVIPPQPGFWAGWLAVPGSPLHAHHELLQVLVEGGVINLVLLLLAGWSMLRPLWWQRQEPSALLLLVAFIAAGAAACIESHLIMPGPLAALAVLAGLAWNLRSEPIMEPTGSLCRLLPLAVGAFGLLMVGGVVVREAQHFGSADLQYRKAIQGLEAADSETERATIRRRLYDRIGPFGDLPYQRSRSAYLGEHDPIAAADWLEISLQRLPVDPRAHHDAKRLSAWLARHGLEERARRLEMARRAAALAATAAIARWPDRSDIERGLESELDR